MAFERYVTALGLDEGSFLERETVLGCRAAMDAIQPQVEQSPGGLFSLKPGWVHLLVDTLGVEVQLGGTPYAALPAPTPFWSSDSAMSRFSDLGASSLGYALATYNRLFVRTDTWRDVSVGELEELGGALQGGRPTTLFVLLNRQQKTKWTSWLDLQHSKGRATVLWGSPELNLRSHNPNTPKFVSATGAWELFALTNPIFGFDFTSCQASAFREAMHNFTRTKGNYATSKRSQTFWHPLPGHEGGGDDAETPPFSFDPKGVELFWRQWEAGSPREGGVELASGVTWGGGDYR